MSISLLHLAGTFMYTLIDKGQWGISLLLLILKQKMQSEEYETKMSDWSFTTNLEHFKGALKLDIPFDSWEILPKNMNVIPGMPGVLFGLTRDFYISPFVPTPRRNPPPLRQALRPGKPYWSECSCDLYLYMYNCAFSSDPTLQPIIIPCMISQNC